MLIWNFLLRVRSPFASSLFVSHFWNSTASKTHHIGRAINYQNSIMLGVSMTSLGIYVRKCIYSIAIYPEACCRTCCASTDVWVRRAGRLEKVRIKKTEFIGSLRTSKRHLGVVFFGSVVWGQKLPLVIRSMKLSKLILEGTSVMIISKWLNLLLFKNRRIFVDPKSAHDAFKRNTFDATVKLGSSNHILIGSQ